MRWLTGTRSCRRILLLMALAAFVQCLSPTEGGVFRRLQRFRRGCACHDPCQTPTPTFELGPTTRIADPKLSGAELKVSFRLLPAGVVADAVVEVLRGSDAVCEIWTGSVQGGGTRTELVWNGKGTDGKFVDTGEYRIRVRGTGPCPLPVETPLNIVRLGITEIAAEPSTSGNDEWQMVYFMKGATYAYFATPATHEYLSVAEKGDLSDLDLNDGNPRSVPPVHMATDSPILEGANYEDDAYNYPLCYKMGVQPQLGLTFGATATSATGQVMSPGYPVPGFDIRLQSRLGSTILATTGPITPGGSAMTAGLTLPNEVTRVDQSVDYVWQYRDVLATDWIDIPGSTTIPLRFYTLIGEPRFKAGAAGTQYEGPWVEVADYWHRWRTSLGLSITTEAACVETHVKGFFGQNSGIPTAIENMVYDAHPLGGNGGGTRYFVSSVGDMDLSSLLNSGSHGPYFNCSDNMGATTTMLSMMGVTRVRPVRLSSMKLRAIWGIGAPSYTTNLWGTSHKFGYHHIVTRDDGVHVIDTCMQLDEDSDPDMVPGVPGWNNDREWAGAAGYESLSASNAVTQTLQTLPGLQ